VIRFAQSAEGIRVRLGRADVMMLEKVRALLGSVGDDPDDPAAERLRPSLYSADEAGDPDVEAMARTELEAGRRADLDVVDETLKASGTVVHTAVLTEEQADAWVRVLGDARLVLGARLGIADDSWERDRSGRLEMALLQYLTYAQASLTEALLDH
jgi:hypothetical protein